MQARLRIAKNHPDGPQPDDGITVNSIALHLGLSAAAMRALIRRLGLRVFHGQPAERDRRMVRYLQGQKPMLTRRDAERLIVYARSRSGSDLCK